MKKVPIALINSRWGFTIVELLIVIVVIGILAAISIVAYSGIQAKANKAVAASSVTQWNKVIKATIDTGGSVLDGSSCLGTASDFPASDGFAAGECELGSTSVDKAFVDSLLTGSGARVNNSKMPLVNYNGLKSRGMVGFRIGLVYIQYYLNGTTCLLASDTATVSGNTVKCLRTI